MWVLRARYWLGADPQALAGLYGYGPRPPVAAGVVAVLARAPVAGQAKTRLAASIGRSAAARAQRRFTIDTVHNALAAGLGRVSLWCAPDAAHRFFRALHRRTGIDLQAQVEGDLGRRMAAVAERHFESTPGLPLLMVGTDCPVLSPGHLQQAARMLSQHEAVLIPALDGGYVLLGLRRMVPEVFEDIAWSTPHVLAQTRVRLRAAGATWCEMEPLWDVDGLDDWQRYVELRRARPRAQVEPAG
ncbi:MAG: glycosyltransferase [Frateuria sp.]|nr:glycosyltransferase [Frateuria sp.]